MLRSMFSGVSGLKVHQQKMDVIGNNIANVNTTSYKSGSITFQEVFSQKISSASKPMEGGVGGTNPQQIGLGVDVGIISNQFEQGSIQRTSNPFDFAIDGEGFFILSDGTGTQYTRAGNFTVDVEGNLVTSGGSYVQGWNYDASIDGTDKVDTTQALQNVNLSDISIPAVATTDLTIAGNLDSNMTPQKVTEEINVLDSSNESHTVTIEFLRNDTVDGQVDYTVTKVDDKEISEATQLTGQIMLNDDGNFDESTINPIALNNVGLQSEDGDAINVDVTLTVDKIKEINTDNLVSDVANYNITIYDSLGVDHTLSFAMKKVSSNNFNYTVSFDGTELEATDEQNFQFNSSGALQNVNKANIVISEDLIGNGATDIIIEAEDITFDDDLLTQYANDTELSMDQNGNAAGEMISYTADQSGQVVATFSNGDQRHIATIAVASFINNNGLEKVGDSEYVSTWNSGDPDVGIAGTSGRGTLATLSLEMSNVDLSNEFTEMIVAQRGFQANSRIITTSDEILQELVNLKR